MNLPQDKKTAKADILQKQLEQTLEIYEAASPDERRCAIRHIDSFLGKVYGENHIFWLKVRERLERMNEGFTMHPEAFRAIISGGNSVFPQ